MMLTMHSILAARYFRKSKILELSIFAVSILLVALAFVDPKILTFFNFQIETARILIGLCSILVFFLSIVSLIVDWKGNAVQFREAFNTLIPLKSEWREILTKFDDLDERDILEFVRKSALILSTLIPIPDDKFNKLKATHYRKVELSKMISVLPGSNIIMLRFKIWWHTNTKLLKEKSEDR